MQSQPQSPWTIDAARATLKLDHWHGTFNLDSPNEGFRVGQHPAAPIAQVFSVGFAQPQQALLKDCYVRENDLIVVYPQREGRHFSVQLNFRILEAAPERLCMELWLSVQTYLLDSHPEVDVGLPIDRHSLVERPASELSPEASFTQAIGGVQGRLASTFLAMLVHPRDQIDTSWSWSDCRSLYQARLFRHFMEKGVIRRARLRCLLTTAELSSGQLREAMDAFATSPLPLTA